MIGKILLVVGLLCAASPNVFSQTQTQTAVDPFTLLNQLLFGPFVDTTGTNTNNALNSLFGLYFLDEYGGFDFDLPFNRRRRRRR